jgi:hypothetical protein
MQSSRAQQLARLPWGSITAGIERATANNERARLARIVRPLQRERKREELKSRSIELVEVRGEVLD